MREFLPVWLYHIFDWPMNTGRNGGYNFFSGVGSGGPWLIAAVWARKHNCHVKRCPRLAWHPHPEHGHPVCKRHYCQAADEHMLAHT